MRVLRLIGLLVSIVGVAAAAPGAARAPAALGIAQLAGVDGCTAQILRDEDEDDAAANATCRRGRGLLDASNVAISFTSGP